ncbi:GGDEF domain-containing protein [Frankia canadensis]|nr:GGDEF domain-containing protein [Frankia canadensis]
MEAAARGGDAAGATETRVHGSLPGDPAAPIRMLATLSRQLIDRRRTRARVEMPHPAVRGQRWLDVRLSTLVRGNGLLVVVDDVTDRRHREDDLRRQATTDPITGLPNRTALRALLTTRLTADPTADARADTGASPGKSGPAVLFLDLDAFRHINNSFGYTVGDAALHASARRFSSVLGAGDIIGRWDGDEFVVLSDTETAQAAADLAERLAAALDEPLEVHGHRIHLSVSVGVALAVASASSAQAGPVGKGSRRGASSRSAASASEETGDALVARAGAEVIRVRSRNRRRTDRKSRSTPQ